MREKLLNLLADHSYRYEPDSPIRLASGQLSPYYVDCKATTKRGDAMEAVGTVFAEHMPAGVEAVGGLTMGADSIADAIASYCTRNGGSMNSFSVRKEAKKHGLGRWIEGPVARGARVAVVDDVITTGGSTLEAIEKCREAGLQVAAVLVLIDREQDRGLDRIKQAAGSTVPVVALYTLTALRERHDAHAHSGRPRSATG